MIAGTVGADGVIVWDFTRAMAEVSAAMEAVGQRAAEAAEGAQAFHDAYHAVMEAEWRGWFYVHPEEAWWER